MRWMRLMVLVLCITPGLAVAQTPPPKPIPVPVTDQDRQRALMVGLCLAALEARTGTTTLEAHVRFPQIVRDCREAPGPTYYRLTR